MRLIPEGEVTIGSPEGRGPADEHPRFTTRLGAFCLDTTEVTRAAYEECVERGACKPARANRVTCSASGKGRDTWPINCVTWNQADAYCAASGKRLPTEFEWEYAASGGDERIYSWGSQEPDGRTCWKENRPCPVGSFEPGAFGLHDMTGNVWEWTDDWYGEYPWPPATGAAKVYRGGSWSRRFEKWMRLRLRNRWGPKNEGAHLGFRCAVTPDGASCPFGREGKRCRHGVLDVECQPGRKWNGARCARENEPRCPAGASFVEGRGCVRGDGKPAGDAPISATGSASDERDEAPAAPITSARTPEFDEDCRTYQPQRPNAVRFEGGTHADRNRAAGERGCKNRDVGVGWNSTCCP